MDDLTLNLLFLGMLFTVTWLVWLWVKGRKYTGYTPLILCGFYLLSSVVGYFIYVLGNDFKGSFYDIGVTDRQMLNSAQGILVICIAIVLGSMTGVGWFGGPRNKLRAGQNAFFGSEVSTTLWLLIFGVSVASLAALVEGIGFKQVFFRLDYIPQTDHIARAVGGTLTPLCVVALGYVIGISKANRTNIVRRYICYLLVLLIEVVFFSMASRRFSFLPFMFAGGIWVGNQESRSARAGLILGVITSLLLIPVPLTLRHQPALGLIPFTEGILNGKIVWDSLETGMLNIFFTLPLAAYVEHASKLSWLDLAISLSPAPGEEAGWDELSDQLRVSVYMPYSAVGELLNYGYTVAFAYSYAIAVFFSALEARACMVGKKLTERGVAVVACVSLFAVMSSQYNLRSTNRLVYYLSAFLIFYWVYQLTIRSLRAKQGTGGVPTPVPAGIRLDQVG